MTPSSPTQMLPESFGTVVYALKSGNFFQVCCSRPARRVPFRQVQSTSGRLYLYLFTTHGRSGVQRSDRLAPQAGRLHTGLVRTTAGSTAYIGCHRHRYHHHPRISPHSSSAGSQKTNHLLFTVLPTVRNALSIAAICIATCRAARRSSGFIHNPTQLSSRFACLNLRESECSKWQIGNK